jgi:hypothetical protein
MPILLALPSSTDALQARDVNLEILTGICAGLHRPNGQTIDDKILVMHAALATVTLKFHRRGHGHGPGELTVSGACGAYEYGTSQRGPGLVPRSLPDG